MIIEQFRPLLSRIKGCTFASLDAETRERNLIRRVANERVILFTNSKSSGYENMVRRRLEEAGKDPDSFVLSDLPWGERIPDTPLITHRGFYYLQTILLKEGVCEWYTYAGVQVPEDVLETLLPKRSLSNQGLSASKQVFVRTYALESIRGIRLLGTELDGAVIRPKLTIKGG